MVLISPFYSVTNFFWIWRSTYHNILKYKQTTRTMMSNPAGNTKNLYSNSIPINSTRTMILTPTIYNINNYKKINSYLLKNNQQTPRSAGLLPACFSLFSLTEHYWIIPNQLKFTAQHTSRTQLKYSKFYKIGLHCWPQYSNRCNHQS